MSSQMSVPQKTRDVSRRGMDWDGSLTESESGKESCGMAEYSKAQQCAFRTAPGTRCACGFDQPRGGGRLGLETLVNQIANIVSE
jgi:hypothetical protein